MDSSELEAAGGIGSRAQSNIARVVDGLWGTRRGGGGGGNAAMTLPELGERIDGRDPHGAVHLQDGGVGRRSRLRRRAQAPGMVGLILYLRGFRLLRSLTRSHRTGSAPIPSALDPTQESDVRFWRQFKLRHESRPEFRTGRDKGTRLAAVSSEGV